MIADGDDLSAAHPPPAAPTVLGLPGLRPADHLGKTLIYLHAAPKSAVTVGDAISKGEVIADEAWRGVSSSSGAHTHIEVRNGRQTHAAVSVGDPNLENPGPTSSWHSQGYNER